ncbi:hypothetical protein IT396_01685 [Candidatus Nomurabacteria bacterium]|nr:hypothetical protein [Candidatus Nomurabacteria bacterium]
MTKRSRIIFGVLALVAVGAFVGDSMVAPTLEQRMEKITFSKPLECSGPDIATEHRAFCKEVAEVLISRAYLRGSVGGFKGDLANVYRVVERIEHAFEGLHLHE